MAVVFRIETMLGVHYDFNELEIGNIREWYYEKQLKLESQLGDITIYSQGVEHYYAEAELINVVASTIARLNIIRGLRDRFWIYPHYLDNADLKYCVVLWNPEAISEFYYHGHPKADQIVSLIFREFVGAVCYPPVPVPES